MMFRRLALRARCWPVVVAATAIALVSVPTITSAQPSFSLERSPGAAGTKPTIVLVHGAWADGSTWDQVIPILLRQGYSVAAPPNPLRGLTRDSAHVASYLSTISGPIVLVGHSYGGAVITNAAVGNANGKALVYVDAFAPASGETLQQLTFSKPGSCLSGGGDLNNVFTLATDPSQPSGYYDLYLKIRPGTNYAGFDACFATFVPPDQAAVLSAVQRPLALSSFTTPSGPPAWASIPSWAVNGARDQAIPPAELTFMAQRAHAKITTGEAGHLSMITRPRIVADVIVDAATATR